MAYLSPPNKIRRLDEARVLAAGIVFATILALTPTVVASSRTAAAQMSAEAAWIGAVSDGGAPVFSGGAQVTIETLW